MCACVKTCTAQARFCMLTARFIACENAEIRAFLLPPAIPGSTLVLHVCDVNMSWVGLSLKRKKKSEKQMLGLRFLGTNWSPTQKHPATLSWGETNERCRLQTFFFFFWVNLSSVKPVVIPLLSLSFLLPFNPPHTVTRK